jgi:hypothetical protein
MMEKLRGISFYLRGSDPGSDLVRAGEFVAFIQRLIATLTAIDVAINGRETRTYRVSNFEVSSAAATLEESIDERLRAFADSLRDVEPCFADLLKSVSQTQIPQWTKAAPDVLVKFRELTEPLSHIAHADIGPGNVRYALDESYRRKVDIVIGKDVVTHGDLVGTLDAVNLHAQPRATLYSRNESVSCEFSPDLTETILNALKKRVRIRGELRRRANSEWPYRVKIDSLEQLPDEADLPLFEDLYGASAEFFPKGIDPVSYIREMRDDDG